VAIKQASSQDFVVSWGVRPSWRQALVKEPGFCRSTCSNDVIVGQPFDARAVSTAKNVIIDREIATLNPNGKTSFQLLQAYGSGKQIPLVYDAFDLLNLEGTDLRSRPLVERRKLLAKVLKKAPDNIRFSVELQGTTEELLRVARQFLLEGLIAKRRDSVYESGPTQRCLVFFIREGNSDRRCPDGC
jgi:ATP dependent DNA ligase domain